MDDLDRIIADLREVANTHILREIADRLAALAGAAPVACPGCNAVGDTFACMRCGAQSTITHAPAKAREVTDADVERALAAYDEKAIKTVHGKVLSPTTAMRAALATFAEGKE